MKCGEFFVQKRLFIMDCDDFFAGKLFFVVRCGESVVRKHLFGSYYYQPGAFVSITGKHTPWYGMTCTFSTFQVNH